jgi:type I restriction enzyme S subunit
LLSFAEGVVEWKTLGEVCSLISAGGDVPENCIKGQNFPSDEFPYPIYANATGEGGLYGFTDKYKIESDAVTISARGAKIGYHTIREGKFTPIISLISLVTNKNIISTKFLNYILYMTPIGGNDGGIPQLTVPDVKKLLIPIPSLEEQNRIVSILDKFDTLTTSISEGLPKEIELRKKQYEYYRDRLLTFPSSEL